MTPQERQLLESLASRVAATNVPQKDAEADALIQSRIGSKPDALYILTQTALVQEIALNQANARLHDLQQQIDSHQGESNAQPTSFLGRLFGSGASARPAIPQQPPMYAPPPAYAPAYEAPQYQAPQYQAPPGGASSFLRSAATTATGVAAGALAFEGIESLFGHHGGGYGGGGFLEQPQETIVNNYYDEPRDAEGRREENRDSFLDSGSSQADSSSDVQYDDSSNVSDAGFDSSSNDSGDDFSSTDV